MIALDHLVVACRSLDAGRDWCEATLGVAPQAGGRHPLMGTHNLLLGLASERHPRAYLELIAIDPDAKAPAQPRWYDLDDPTLRDALQAGPRLVHWVARCDDIEATAAALRAVGGDPGVVVPVERMTPRGPLRWRITLPADGRRPSAGAMPLWIQWSSGHPSDALPASDIAIEAIEIGRVAASLAAHVGALVTVANAEGPLRAVLVGPRGRVVLTAPGALSA